MGSRVPWIIRNYLNCVEQFRDHSCDPSKERWPAATLHLASIALDLHEGSSLLFDVLHYSKRIDVLHSRQEDSVDPSDLFQFAQILFYRSGIGREVFVGCKLGWVDKN